MQERFHRIFLQWGNKVNAQPGDGRTKGKRLIIASEMQEGVRLNTAMVKQLCSTDEIQACKKYKDPFHFVPSHQVVLYTNHLPKVGANDEGIWRRLKVIPFNAKIHGNSDIKNYADYLYEKAAPSIMKWIIEGAEKVSKADLKVSDPKCVEDAVEAYREDNDWLGHFLADCCELGSNLEENRESFISSIVPTVFRVVNMFVVQPIFMQQLNRQDFSDTRQIRAVSCKA